MLVEVVLDVDEVEVVEVDRVAALRVATSQPRTVMLLKLRHVAREDSI